MYSKNCFNRARSLRLVNRQRRAFHIELLEHRNLMAADVGLAPSSANGMQSRQWFAAPEEYFQKSAISKELIAAADPTVVGNGMSNYLMRDQKGRIDVHFSGEDVAAVVAKAAELGFEPVHVDLARRTADGFISAGSVAQLKSALAGLSVGVTPNYRPLVAAGVVTSEADTVLQTERLRQLVPAGYNGAGIRIGVLSDSFDNLNGASLDVARGDLPWVQVLQDLDGGGSDEGRAMLQLVHDVAPAAMLGFATGGSGGQAGFAANITALAATFGADVITDDIFYFAEPYFQDGIIAQAIDNVVRNYDVAYFSLAGNLSDQAYERKGPFTKGSVSFAADNFGVAKMTMSNALDLNPGSGVDFRQSIVLNDGQTALIGLQWDSPFYASVNTDLDIYLVDQATNQLVAFSDGDAIATDEPVDIFNFRNTTGATRTYEIIINRKSGPDPGRIKWVNFGANSSGPITTIEYDTNSPTIIPHAAARGAMAVGAVPYFDQKTPESFSSIGPATILFSPNGSRVSETVRAKPDMMATDGVNNSFFGVDVDGDGRPNFFGTSAAAPHAAAVAAIVRQANPGFDAAAVYARMKQTATDIGARGVDNVTGAGLINAFKAVMPTVARPRLPGAENFFWGLGNQWEVNSSGNGRVRVLSPGNDGNNQLVMDTFNNERNSLNEAILNFNATGVSDIELRFDQREFADDDHPMPARFTGSHPSDGVALSVDGVNWFRLISLTGANSTSTYTTRRFNLSQFAAANGLTLGSRVRIKFQQYDDMSLGSDGFAFDNISVGRATRVAATGTLAGGSAAGGSLGGSPAPSLAGLGSGSFLVNSPSSTLVQSSTANSPLTVNLTAGASTGLLNKGAGGSGMAVGSDTSKQLAKAGSAAARSAFNTKPAVRTVDAVFSEFDSL